MTTDKLKKEFPLLKLITLNSDTGCNLYLPGKLIITIFYTKKIYKTNKKKTNFRHYINDTDLFKIINQLGNFEFKKREPIKELPPTEKQENAGVRACIDHVEKKYQAFIKVHPNDNRTAAMLKIIQKEFYQYL